MGRLKYFYIFMFINLMLFLSACQNDEPGTEKAIFNQVEIVTDDPKTFSLIELKLHGDEDILNNGNPFRSDYLDITITLTSPTDKKIKAIAFWYQDYNRIFNDQYPGKPQSLQGKASTNPDELQGLESLVPQGEPHFRVRFLPTEAGNWRYEVHVNGKLQKNLNGLIKINEKEDSSYRGIIQVDQTNKRHFIDENNHSFIPVGQNVAWYTSSTRKTTDYEIWFMKMHQANSNFARIWLADWGFALAAEPATYEDFTNRLNQAYRFDYVLNLAHSLDIYIMLTLLHHGQFSEIVNSRWSLNPWNKENGGILTSPSAFFLNEEAKKIYKDQLRYIVARWGYSGHIMAWELFNEVTWIEGYNSTLGSLWHKEMASYIKSIDYHKHMVTTSTAMSPNNSNIVFHNKAIDFTNIHCYDYFDTKYMSVYLPQEEVLNAHRYDKPVLFSEVGINWHNGNANYELDPTGISLHLQLWAGALGGGAGTAMNWWWDSWVHPHDLYHRFIGIGNYSKEMDLVGSTYHILQEQKETKTSEKAIKIIGYRIDDKVYAYIFDKNYQYNHPDVPIDTNVQLEIPISNGTYQLDIYHTETGVVIDTKTIQVTNQIAHITLTQFHKDCAIILK